MKFTLFPAIIAGCGLLLAVGSGCSKSDSTSHTSAPDTNSLSAAASDMKQTTQQAITEVRAAAERTTAEAGRQVSAVTDQAQKLIDQAKTLIAERKYNEAWEALTRVSGFQLTPEQKKSVDDLKSQLQKLMATPGVSNAVDAARGLLR